MHVRKVLESSRNINTSTIFFHICRAKEKATWLKSATNSTDIHEYKKTKFLVTMHERKVDWKVLEI